MSADHSLVIRHSRGGAVESEHAVSAVACAPDGAVRFSVGPDVVTTWRSGAKPFQLEGSLSCLPPEVVASLADEDLAVGAASHSGEPDHVARVRALLARFGLGETALRCGAHWPVHRESELALARAGEGPSQLHNNCSGKHSFMALASRLSGWDADYLPPSHPLQRALRAVVDARSGEAVRDVCVDGCGAPCFILPLSGMAAAYAQLAMATWEGDGALGRIGRAMAAHPRLVSGTGRSDLALVERARRPFIAKVGAEALLCLALPAEGVGVAVKVRTGNNDARDVAVAAVLERWFPGALPEGAPEAWGEVRNVVGRLAGRREAVWG